MRTPISIIACGLILTTGLATAGDWAQWHGANRDNISTETGLLTEWPAGGPRLVWKATGIGDGYSGVSIVKGRIYTMGDIGDSAYVEALEFRTGKKLWQTPVGPAGDGGGYPGPRATPTVDGDLVYALGQSGDLVCVMALSGKELWRKSLTKDFGGKMMSGWGYSESLLVDGEKLLCTPGGKQGTVVALNKRTGAPIWSSKEFTDSASYASLIVVNLRGTRQIIVLTDANVAGIAADTGALLWKGERRGQTAVVPTPVFKDDSVFVSSGYGVGCNLFKVTGAGRQFSAEQVYANKNMVNHHGGVISLGNHLYGYSDGKGWVCMDLKTGEITWSERQKLGKGTLSYADGHFYLRAESGPGTIVLIEATPTGFVEKGRFDQPDRSGKNSWPHLVISNGGLFVRDQDVLLCYDIRKK